MDNKDLRASLVNRFVRYASLGTQSDPDSENTPSTPEQGYFAELLADELEEIGLSDIHVSRYSYVTATLPPSDGCEADDTIGFIAHLDTSPDVPGRSVTPIITSYTDGDLIVTRNDSSSFVIPLSDNLDLQKYCGEDIITSDGTTLLGADDKAGIAEIISAMEYLLRHPEIKHGRVRICFTPDEEIGRGADHFDIARFDAKYAYTIDGGARGELEFENFNAAEATITFSGRNMHPGYAKGRLLNAAKVASEFVNTIYSHSESPEETDGRQGFYHLTSIGGTTESATAHFIIRDFEKLGMLRRKDLIRATADQLNAAYGEAVASVEIKDSYNNMSEVIERHRNVVERAERALVKEDLVPNIVPIRGGTDGARLSFMGLPCPNLFAGGHNFHSLSEYLPIESMVKSAHVIINICKSRS